MQKERIEKMGLPPLMRGQDGREIVTAEQWSSRRQEILDMLRREEYGYSPAAPGEVYAEIEQEGMTFGGKALQRKIRLSFETPKGRFSFPYILLTPKGQDSSPAFVAVNFMPEIPHKYLPAEEIIDHGFAVAAMYYQDVTSDNGDLDGIAAMYPRDDKTGWGKIGMWAFAASRVMDDLEKRPEIDGSRVCVTGHSRLGKTALWCAAQDERFTMAISNESGCAGAAVARGNQGETVRAIADRFPYWFCGNYVSWAGREDEMPFDQHMLLALIAPRKLYVSSAQEDLWADPENEFMACLLASPAWNLLGEMGMIAPDDQLPDADHPLHEGAIGHHIRKGSHFFSRTDWGYHMVFREKHGI